MTHIDVDPTVSLIHIPTWENDLEVVARPGRELEVLPYDSLIGEGRDTGGRVLMLHAEGTTQLWAVPPEVTALLKGMLLDDQYRKLLQRTPSLAGLDGR